MRAYSQFYLEDSMRNLAGMFDYAVRGLNYYPDDFFSLFIDSGVASLYEHGNPRYVCGLSGIELCQNVLGKTGKDFFYVETHKSFDGPEYWCGWALAYFQWQTNLGFKEINNYISISEILAMYSPYHEMDISQFCDKMIELYNKRKNNTNLKALRLDAGLSQSELAEISDIPVRTIQQYEQNQKNINAAKAETVVKLAKALNCTVEALMEAV